MARPRKQPDEKLERFFVGLTPHTLDMLRHFTALHGRDDRVTEEVRAALDLYIAEAMLDALDRPEFVEALSADRPDFDLEAERKKAKRTAEVLRAHAFERPTQAFAEHGSALEKAAQRGREPDGTLEVRELASLN